ncbi:MAG TPA: hypothetical protein VLZ77_02345 [Acidimicrobiales bacterium]|nr:hypothetical protein [Acidimicrobiales bacterium]
MARIFGFLRLGGVLTMAVLSVTAASPALAAGPSSPAGSPAAAPPVPGTPLPPGWEQCVLQGVGAPNTADDVADLDQWQTAEGGSTNNAAAYNPFNTRQMTDATGAALPVAATPGGFPAFRTWEAGCAATVATLLQPDMAPIVAALAAGDVSPPGLFLAAVDQSPWCAPSSDGVPCYAGDILAAELLRALLHGRSAQLNAVLTSYADTGTDLGAYEKAAYVVAVEQGQVAERTAELDAAQQALSGAQAALGSVTRTLRHVALNDYTSGAVVQFDPSLAIVTSPDAQDVEEGYFRSVAVGQAVLDFDRARSAFDAAAATQRLAQAAVVQATAAADAASAAEGQALGTLQSDVQGLESGLSCAPPSLVTTAAAPVAGADDAAQLWQGLQGCLAPAGQAAPVTASAASS